MTAPSPVAVGVVAELWRYPVKSLQGERLAHATLAATGIDGDRAWGVLDPATGRVLSAETAPRLLDATATTTPDGVRIGLPDGVTLDPRDRACCDRALSEWLGRPVALRPADAGLATSYEMTFDPPDDDADPVEIATPPGTLFDLAAVHLLTTGSLATAAAAHPAGAWTTRRFRPNLLVDTRPGGAGVAPGGPEPDDAGAVDPDGGYPEDGWVERSLAVGAARLRVLMRTVRCAIPLRAQPALDGEGPLARDVGIYRSLARLHDNHLGAYATVTDAGTIAVGDPVTLRAGD